MALGRILSLATRLAIAVGISLQIAPPLLAQSVTAPTPPLRTFIDANNVDLQTGFLSLSEPGISIGDPANGGLSSSRSYGVQPDTVASNGGNGIHGWRHNWMLTALVTNWGAGTLTIAGAGYSDAFHGMGTGVSCPFQQLSHMGATITCPDTHRLIYTARDGTVITFDNTQLANSASFTEPTGWLATTMVKPNGEVITFTYKTANYVKYGITFYMARLQAVSNNYGYMLKYGYGSNDPNAADAWETVVSISAINLANGYCDPSADSCSGTWPTLTITSATLTDGSGASYLAQITTYPSGRTVTYNYSGGQILGIKSPFSANMAIQYTYSTASTYDQRIALAVRNGVTYSYSYSTAAQSDGTTQYTVLASRGGQINWYAISNETYGQVIKYQYGPNNPQIQYVYSYDSYGRLQQALGPGGVTPFKVFSYDDRGNATQFLQDGKIYSASFTATCTNPVTCNQPNTVTDPRGNVTSFTYDATHGGLLAVTAPAAASGGVQPQSRTSYAQFYAYYKNATGTIVQAPTAIWKPTGTSACMTTASCVGTADETTTSINYGATGVANNLLPVSTTTAAGDGSISSTTSVTYDMVGNKILADGPLPGNADTSTWVYDVDRRVVQTIGPDPDGAGPLHNRSARTTYNAAGEATSVSTGTSNPDGSGFVELSRTDTTFDAYGRKIESAVTAGGTIQSRTDYSYDTADRLSCSAVRMNPVVFATLTANACTLGTQGAFGPDRITYNVYNQYDQIWQIQTAYGLPYQRSEIFNFNGNLLASVKDAKGNLTSYTYDNTGALASIRYPDKTNVGASSWTDIESFTYDANHYLTTHTLRDGKQISYTYDNLGRQVLAHMVNPVDANDHDIATSYDLLGRVTSVDDGSGKKVGFTYDQLGRKLTEAPQLTGGSTSYQYDAAGRRTRLTWSDGFYVTYDYDTLGELLAIRENGAISGVGVLASFAYDDQGKPTGLTRGNGINSSYAYDAASRLQSYTISHPTAGNVYTFAYNPAGQMISRGMTNDAYAYAQAAYVNRNYTVNGLNQYTASGSVVPSYDGRGNTTSAGATTYVYDSKNQLTTFGVNSLSYDAEGRLAAEAVPGTTRFVYDGSDLIAETDASNAILRRYVHIPGSDNVLVWYEGAGTTDRRWLAHDERMSTTLVTDASGNSLGINSYDEYGIPASTNIGRFQYTGQTYLPELGMYYYKARIYSATMGRFMQTDPIGYGDGPNWYNYAHGDPMNGTDPTGHDMDKSDWKCYGSCGQGYANDSDNGFFQRTSDNAAADLSIDKDGPTVSVSADFKWVNVGTSVTDVLNGLSNVLSGLNAGLRGNIEQESPGVGTAADLTGLVAVDGNALLTATLAAAAKTKDIGKVLDPASKFLGVAAVGLAALGNFSDAAQKGTPKAYLGAVVKTGLTAGVVALGIALAPETAVGVIGVAAATAAWDWASSKYQIGDRITNGIAGAANAL